MVWCKMWGVRGGMVQDVGGEGGYGARCGVRGGMVQAMITRSTHVHDASRRSGGWGASNGRVWQTLYARGNPWSHCLLAHSLVAKCSSQGSGHDHL